MKIPKLAKDLQSVGSINVTLYSCISLATSFLSIHCSKLVYCKNCEVAYLERVWPDVPMKPHYYCWSGL